MSQPKCQTEIDEELTQDKPFRKYCSECGNENKEYTKFKNFNIHAMNGVYTSTVCEYCRRRICHDI